MSTVEESLTSITSIPCSAPGSQDDNRGRESLDNNSSSAAVVATRATEVFPANACHFPPEAKRPKSAAYRCDDYIEGGSDASALPERCQFMFSDGRQCTMARSDIHPSLCTYHSEREEQLFGTPYVSPPRVVPGARFDLPELYSACSDLRTPAGVGRAVAQVIRLLAQRRISRQEATTFGQLAHVMLQTFAIARGDTAAATVTDPDLKETAPRQLGQPASVSKPNGSVTAECAYSNRISTCKNLPATQA